MAGTLQAAFMNQRSFIEPAPTVIGQAYGGGFWVGEISTSGNGVATHNLVVGPLSTAQTTLKWKNANTATTGADSNIDGPQNTADMVADGNATVYPAAHFCNDLTTGGYSDWYLPAKNELEIYYFNLKTTTTSNNAGSGINPNAVPARIANYTAGNPAQTSAAAFQTGGAQAFTDAFYWSSSDHTNDTGARCQNLGYGYQFNALFKDTSALLRAARRVAL
jgi:hypothetical protein